MTLPANWTDGGPQFHASNQNDVETAVNNAAAAAALKYTKPAGGIPESDLTTAAQGKLNGIGTVAVSGTPTAGQVPTATSGSAATWQNPTGGGGGMTDPLTTKGDLIVRTASATTRLGVGTTGQALLADSAQPAGVRWGAVGGGESGIGTVTVSGTPTIGQVPTALTGTTASWQTPSGGGSGVPNDGSVTTAKIVDAAVTVPKINAGGTPNAATFLRGDGTWVTPGSVATDPRFPEAYGAVGNGTTNDTTAMQSWLNWVKVGNRTGYLYPGKTYRIVSPLLWNTAGPIYHAHIDGQGATLLMATDNTSHIRVTEEFLMNHSIRNIRFDYVNQQTAASGKACIVFDTGTTLGFGWFDWMFEHLTFMQRCNKGIENTETGVNAVWGSTFRHLFSEYGTTGPVCKIRSASAGMPNNWFDHIYQNRNSNPNPALDLSFQTCARITNFEVNEAAVGGPDLKADLCWGLSMDTVRTENGVNNTGDAIYLFSESRQVSVDNWQIINRPFANTGYVFRGTNTSFLSIGPGLIDTYSGSVPGANCTVASLDGTSKLTRYEQVCRPAAVVDGATKTTGTITYTGAGSNANRMVTL
jgi:hypothetical protein